MAPNFDSSVGDLGIVLKGDRIGSSVKGKSVSFSPDIALI